MRSTWMAAELFPVRQKGVIWGAHGAPETLRPRQFSHKPARFTDSSPPRRGVFPCYGQVTRKLVVMADILVVLGIIGFVAGMLSVVFGLGRAERRQLNYSGASAVENYSDAVDRRSSVAMD